jgi:uncharacterized delta-60 repeat protein
MIALPGDRLLLSGTVSGRFGTAVVKADRTLDSTWSADGLAPVDFGNSDDIAGRSVQQTNGRIVVASTSLNTFAVTRYLPTGALDTTFSQDGKTTIDFGAQYLKAVASDVAVQADGRIVVVGYVSQVEGINQSSVEDHIAVARLNANGTLDTTFGTNGTVITRLGGYGRATTVKIQPNGRIVVGGSGDGGYFTWDHPFLTIWSFSRTERFWLPAKYSSLHPASIQQRCSLHGSIPMERGTQRSARMVESLQVPCNNAPGKGFHCCPTAVSTRAAMKSPISHTRFAVRWP